jgi:hypothetical protein
MSSLTEEYSAFNETPKCQTGFEFWWTEGAIVLLTTQPRVGSHFGNVYFGSEEVKLAHRRAISFIGPGETPILEVNLFSTTLQCVAESIYAPSVDIFSHSCTVLYRFGC